MIKVEKSVPLPAVTRNAKKIDKNAYNYENVCEAIWEQLKQGDSTVITELNSKVVYARLERLSIRKSEGRIYTVRKIDNKSFRIWRIL